MAQGHWLGRLEKSGRQRFDFRGAIDSAPIEHCEMATEAVPADLDDITALEPQIRLSQPPDWSCGSTRPQCQALRLALQLQLEAGLSEPGRGRKRGQRGRPQAGHYFASIQREFGACHRTNADHFLVCLA